LFGGLGETDTEIWSANYDVAPDGQRFLFAKSSGSDKPATEINVVLGWFTELTRRVRPTK